MNKNKNYWVEKHKMKPPPEGGFYKETFRADLSLNTPWGKRRALTSIYYLLSEKENSSFHKIKSTELWYHHSGESLIIHEITEDGEYFSHLLNSDNPFIAIKPNSWFGSEVKDCFGFVLVSCAVAPGFEFQDFELAKKENLLKEFPEFSEIIMRLAQD